MSYVIRNTKTGQWVTGRGAYTSKLQHARIFRTAQQAVDFGVHTEAERIEPLDPQLSGIAAM